MWKCPTFNITLRIYYCIFVWSKKRLRNCVEPRAAESCEFSLDVLVRSRAFRSAEPGAQKHEGTGPRWHRRAKAVQDAAVREPPSRHCQPPPTPGTPPPRDRTRGLSGVCSVSCRESFRRSSEIVTQSLVTAGVLAGCDQVSQLGPRYLGPSGAGAVPSTPCFLYR